LQFTAREADEAGLYYYRARYYHPLLARFVSEDPISAMGNAYPYALNNPVNFVDPSGLCVPFTPDVLLDLGFITYDVYRLIVDGRKGRAVNLAALGLDLTGACTPALTGLGLAARLGKAGKPFKDNQRALIELAKDAKRTGVTPEDANTLVHWANEYGLSSHPPTVHSGRPGYGGTVTHINIGPVHHITVR
jgi:RHS repeat-associated protein